MSVITNDSAKINQLFVRMNRNKPLTGAEIRNAMKGAVPPAIRAIAKHKFFTQKCSFPTNRGQDKNVAAKLLLLSHSNQFVNTKKNDLDTFVKRFEQSSSNSTELAAAEKKAIRTLDELAGQFSDTDSKLKASGLIPVYFRVVEQHGAERFGEFLTFWNTYSVSDETTLSNSSFVDDHLKMRVRVFNLLKRNVNDSTSMQRLFAVLSLEFRRFQVGVYAEEIKSMGRFVSKVKAAKRKSKNDLVAKSKA
ncbi:MAG: hypothetical protein EOO85_32950 [Pedobacter sp.]|nr:MAG: hypothetical protein EOO85_32950 [Pedobacter sp.]